jgi:hypothetical protein
MGRIRFLFRRHTLVTAAQRGLYLPDMQQNFLFDTMTPITVVYNDTGIWRTVSAFA